MHSVGRCTSERLERIAADLDALATVPGRFAGSEGERAALHAVKSRLPEDLPGRIEGFVAPSAVHLSLGLHALALFITGLLGLIWPIVAALLSLLLAISLYGEGTGRFSLVQWAYPKTASYNLVARMAVEAPMATLVLTAPLDVPRWRLLNRRWGWFRPLRLVFASAVALGIIQVLHVLARPWGVWTGTVYGVGLAVFAGTVALGAVWHRAGSGTDDGGSPAVLLDIAHRLAEQPIPDVDVWVAFVGCGRQSRGGMDAFLALHRETLGAPVFVIALDDAGRPPLQAVVEPRPFPEEVASVVPLLGPVPVEQRPVPPWLPSPRAVGRDLVARSSEEAG